MDVTFGDGMQGTMIEALGLDTDESGYVLTSDGDYAAVSDDRERLHKDEIAAFEHDESKPDDTLLIPDNFCEIVDHQKRMDEKDIDEKEQKEAVENLLESVADSIEEQEELTRKEKLLADTIIIGLTIIVVALVRKVKYTLDDYSM